MKPKIDKDILRRNLKIKSANARAHFTNRYKSAHKALKDQNLDIGKLRKHSAKVVASTAIAGTLLLAPPTDFKSLPSPHKVLAKIIQPSANLPAVTPRVKLTTALNEILPEEIRPLTREEEKYLEQVFKEIIHVNAKATLESEHLNTTFGKIGAEQHLRRYPGDTLNQHGTGDEIREGMAPGLGAWGYFAPSKDKLTDDLVETEKWYAVVQTLYLHDWNTRQPFMKDWYKHRKVIMVNTQNGKAVAASISDSGPAAWTGKHYGGSPEVMNYLGGPKYKKGPVIVFFIDDPQNSVPLGPIEYNSIDVPGAGVINYE